MLRRLRTVVLVVVAAALGAALGRVALQARQRIDAGESPSDIDFGQIGVRFQDVIPGLVAAFRVKDAPWSWFHIPSWLAAFAVNFGVGAAGGDIASLRARAERMAFDAVGLDAREFGMGGEWDDETETPTDATGSTTHASCTTTIPRALAWSNRSPERAHSRSITTCWGCQPVAPVAHPLASRAHRKS